MTVGLRTGSQRPDIYLTRGEQKENLESSHVTCSCPRKPVFRAIQQEPGEWPIAARVIAVNAFSAPWGNPPWSFTSRLPDKEARWWRDLLSFARELGGEADLGQGVLDTQTGSPISLVVERIIASALNPHLCGSSEVSTAAFLEWTGRFHVTLSCCCSSKSFLRWRGRSYLPLENSGFTL